MSWRASPSRPAPPSLSSEADHASMFGGTPGRSQRSYRPPGATTSGTAAAHLARQLAERDMVDDDRMSIRSGRSGVTLNGNGGGAASLFAGRSRKGSGSAASVQSGRMSRRSDGESIAGSEVDELELTRTGKVGRVEEQRQSAVIARPESDTGGTVPQVVKRQRVESTTAKLTPDSSSKEPSAAGKRPGWFGGSKADPSSRPIVPAAQEEPASLSLEESAISKSSTSTPPAFVPPKFVPSPAPPSPAPVPTPTTATHPRAPTPTPPPEPTPSQLPTLRPPRASEVPLSRRASWFGYSYVTPAPPPEAPPPTISEEPFSTPTASLRAPSLHSRSSSLASSSVQEADDNDDAGDGTIRARQGVDEGDRTITPRPSQRQIASVANQRSSWWGWGGSTTAVYVEPPTPEPNPFPPPAPTPPLEDLPAPNDATPSVSSSTSSLPANILPPPPKSWLSTIWGESPEELILRRQRESAEAMMSQAAALGADGSSDISSRSASMDGSNSNSSPANSGFSAAPATVIEELPPVKTLKHTSSWSFFSPRASSTPANSNLNTSTTTTPTSTTPTTPTAAAPI
ncbi:hypothetical protein P7C70_g8288, partial [Phenoliferia sp. Uapishka_3]